MAKRKTFIVSLCVLLVLTSCSEDDLPFMCLPVKMNNPAGLDGSTLEFAYNNRQLKTITWHLDFNGSRVNFVLNVSNSDNKVVRLMDDLNTIVIDVTYDANDQVSGITQNSSGFKTSQSFAYNQNGQIIRIDHFIDDGLGGFAMTRYDIFSYPNSVTKNPASRTISMKNGATFITHGKFDYEYDDKKSLLKDIPIMAYLFDLYGESNQTKTTETGTGFDPIVTNISYEYSDNGYPTNFIYTRPGNSTVIGAVDYDCR